MKLSVVIPAHNEAASLPQTVGRIVDVLSQAGISHEIIVADDHSTDETAACLAALRQAYPTVRTIANQGPQGFGYAVRAGLAAFSGEAVAIVMADGSDDPRDLLPYHAKLLEGYDCVFGSRFMRGSLVVGYPWHKLVLNRLANTFLQVVFRVAHNDLTNAFKGYRRTVIEGVQPLVAQHFNLTVELPLKALVRGYSYATVPIRWYQRKHGISKLKIHEMGSRYLAVVWHVFLEQRRQGRHAASTASAPEGAR